MIPVARRPGHILIQQGYYKIQYNSYQMNPNLIFDLKNWKFSLLIAVT